MQTEIINALEFMKALQEATDKFGDKFKLSDVLLGLIAVKIMRIEWHLEEFVRLERTRKGKGL